MRAHATILILLAILVCLPATRAFAEDEGENAQVKKQLQRKVTFEFADTPLTDAIEFLDQISKVTFVIDPKVAANPPMINLLVADMSLELALEWILKLAELEHVITGKSVFITNADGIKERNLAEYQNKQKKGAGGENTEGILRARFVTGDMIEVDASMLKKFPHLQHEILSLTFDPVKDEILALAIGRDIPPHVSIVNFIESIKKIAPEAKVNHDENLKLLLITSETDSDLHRINAVARALRRSSKDSGMKMPPHFKEQFQNGAVMDRDLGKPKFIGVEKDEMKEVVEQIKAQGKKDLEDEMKRLIAPGKKGKFGEPGQVKPPATVKDEF